MAALELLWFKATKPDRVWVNPAMWMETLFAGVLRVLTPLGPRYVNPSLPQRVYLLWIFRNFHTLPAKVLSLRQQRWIDRMCAERGFVSLFATNGLGEMPVLGTLEQRPPTEPASLPPRRPSQNVQDAVPAFATDLRQRS